jgi:hypothetical protein
MGLPAGTPMTNHNATPSDAELITEARKPQYKYIGRYSEMIAALADRLEALTAKPAGNGVTVKPLNDDEIMEIIREVAPWQSEAKLNDLLTYEKSPPLFPQATYDVPSYRAEKFVRAVERRILSALELTNHPTSGAAGEDRRELLMAIENVARMAEQGVLSADGGMAAAEIRSLIPQRFRTTQPAHPVGDGVEVVGWMHPRAGWCDAERYRVEPHCLKDGSDGGPQPLIRLTDHQHTVDGLRAKLSQPDFVFDPDEWEYTCEWGDRSMLTDEIPLGGVMRLSTLIKGPDKFAAHIPVSWDDEGDPDETEVQWFDSEEAARAALSSNDTSKGGS